MKLTLILFSIYILCVFHTPFAFAEGDEAATAEPGVEKKDDLEAKPLYVICKNKNIVRTIRINKNGSSCDTTYTKDGIDSIVGKSKTESVCRDVFEKIKVNLEKGAWKCKDITQSHVSISNVE